MASFPEELILGRIQWHGKYGTSYGYLEETMLEHGLEVDHTALCRWAPHYTPEMEKREREYWKLFMRQNLRNGPTPAILDNLREKMRRTRLFLQATQARESRTPSL